MQPTIESNNANEAWHALTSEEVLQRLTASPLGLAEDEAQKRLMQYGPNSIAGAKRESLFLRFCANSMIHCSMCCWLRVL